MLEFVKDLFLRVLALAGSINFRFLTPYFTDTEIIIVGDILPSENFWLPSYVIYAKIRRAKRLGLIIFSAISKNLKNICCSETRRKTEFATLLFLEI